MEAKLIEQMIGSALIVVISMIFLSNSDVLYGEGFGAFIVSNVARFGFVAGLAWFGYELWLFIQRRRLLAAITALAPNHEELDRRLDEGQNIDDIARDFREQHDVPEQYTINLALEAVQQWLSSEDAAARERAQRFIAGQRVDSSEPPELFLDRIKEDSVGIYVDRSVLCYLRAPSLCHFAVGGETKEVGHDDTGTLLLTTAYLYFLCDKPRPRHSGQSWHVRLGRLLFDLVRYPLASLVQFLQDLVPWLGETISIGTKLQIVLGQTFSARQVRIFKKQFAYEGSFAIPLAKIDSLSMTQPFVPVGNLEVGFVTDDGSVERVWFRSTHFAVNQQSRRNWIIGRQESLRDWTQEWIDRIRQIALGEGRLIEDGPARLPDWLAWQSRPVNVWNRGDQGPLSNSAVAKIKRRAPWAITMLIGLMFAVWSSPVIVFYLLVQSGNDPFDWLESLGTWGPALFFVGLAAWIGSLFFAIKIASAITFRMFPKVEPRDHFEFWHQGPMSILKNPKRTLKPLAEDPDGLGSLLDHIEREYRTPPAHTRLAVGEMVLRALEDPDPSIRQLARQAAADRAAESTSPMFPNAPSTKTNIYSVENLRLEECSGLVPGKGIILISLDGIFLFSGSEADLLLELDDFDDLTPETIDRLSKLLSTESAVAFPLRDLRDIRASVIEPHDAENTDDVPMLIGLEFVKGDGASGACRLEMASHRRTFHLMGIIWCAAELVGNTLVWSETELRMTRDSDRNIGH